MMELLRFIFDSGWHFAGVIVLLYVLADGIRHAIGWVRR